MMVRLLCAFVLTISFSTASLGQPSLVGTYKMVSQVVDVEGAVTENMGKAPRGYLVLTPTRATAFYTAESRKPGTAEAEKAALFDTLGGWSGRYRTEANRLIVSVDVSWVEIWNGKDQVRNYELSGTRLALTSDPMPFARDPSKKVVVRQVWEKIE